MAMELSALLSAFTRLRPGVEAMVRGRVACGAAAEDIMQDLWIRLAGVEPSQRIDNAAGFTVRAARNAVVDHARKQRRRRELDGEAGGLLLAGSEAPCPERIVSGRQTLRAVEAALQTMPERSRQIFLMNRLGGVTHREIADRLGISEQAVYYHIRRVMERLSEVRDAVEG
jgi:RNA polymerase sigma factor, sigma-70 family